MLRTACIRLNVTPEQAERLSALRSAYAEACNRLVPLVQKERITADRAIPALCFNRASVHFDHRTYTLKGEAVSLYTLQGRMLVPMILGDHQRQILQSSRPRP